ncbi:MAG TPA: DUF488 domain-containing protein [Steroidobacteraceae bacterium]
MTFQIKRIYDRAQPSDGIRVLVDRLWPRGVKKTDARLDYWLKDVAPSTQLRRWFDHLPARFGEFRRKYRTELAGNPGIGDLRKLGRGKQVTLLYAAQDPEVNHALVLRDVLKRGAKKTRLQQAVRQRT